MHNDPTLEFENPARQGSHDVAAYGVDDVPAGHFEQAVDPVLFEY